MVPTIPRQVHVVSLADGNNSAEWQMEGGNQYVIKQWTKKEMQEFIGRQNPDMLAAWEKLPLEGMQVDIWMHLLLHRLGGIVVNGQVTPDRRILDATRGPALYVAWIQRGRGLTTSIAAASQGSPIALSILRNAVSRLKNFQTYDILDWLFIKDINAETTGRAAITDGISRWTDRNAVDIQLEPGKYGGLRIEEYAHNTPNTPSVRDIRSVEGYRRAAFRKVSAGTEHTRAKLLSDGFL